VYRRHARRRRRRRLHDAPRAALDAASAAPRRAEELHRRAYNASFEHYELTIDGAPLSWSVEYYDVLANTVGGGKPKMKARARPSVSTFNV
jgi:hypothetical protein